MSAPGPPAAWVPRPYPQLLRGPAHRWWRALVGLAVVLGGLLAVLAWTLVSTTVAAMLSGVQLAVLAGSFDQWWMLLITNLGLAALVPIAMLAVWAGHGWRPRWLTSVAPGLRWRWLWLCAAVGLVVTALSLLVPYALAGAPTGQGRQVIALLTVVAVTTPLQAAGEEYLFRGWLTQAIGSLFSGARSGAVVAAVVSATLFALAHGGQAPWLFLDRFAFGVLASYLTWRTGGLEAAIAVRAANNVVVFVPTILTGGLAGVLTVTDAPAAMVLLDLLAMAVIAVVISWLARRLRVQRVFVPPPAPGPVLAPPTHLR